MTTTDELKIMLRSFITLLKKDIMSPTTSADTEAALLNLFTTFLEAQQSAKSICTRTTVDNEQATFQIPIAKNAESSIVNGTASNMLGVLTGVNRDDPDTIYMALFNTGFKTVQTNPPSIEAIGEIEIITTRTKGSPLFEIDEDATNDTGHLTVVGQNGKTVDWTLNYIDATQGFIFPEV